MKITIVYISKLPWINIWKFIVNMEIIYESEHLIAINKPHGLLVHRTNIAADAHEFALQKVRNHIGTRVYPVHRLDRKTSGVLLFAKSQESNSYYQSLFRNGQVDKGYIAIVRGFISNEGTIDYPLKKMEGKVQDAITHYKRLEKYEINLPSGKFNTSRYSLVELRPATGRFHQLRKHMAHIMHPILGDRPHGCNKQNRLWKEKFEMTKMLLHASSLALRSMTGRNVVIEAGFSTEFERVLSILRGENL